MDKTELIYFFPKSQEQGEEITLFQDPNQRIKPKSVVRWLGIWFNSRLSFKVHVKKRVFKAEQTLNGLLRLSNTERGLSFQAIRQLYIACITLIADYGVQIW